MRDGTISFDKINLHISCYLKRLGKYLRVSAKIILYYTIFRELEEANDGKNN